MVISATCTQKLSYHFHTLQFSQKKVQLQCLLSPILLRLNACVGYFQSNGWCNGWLNVMNKCSILFMHNQHQWAGNHTLPFFLITHLSTHYVWKHLSAKLKCCFNEHILVMCFETTLCLSFQNITYSHETLRFKATWRRETDEGICQDRSFLYSDTNTFGCNFWELLSFAVGQWSGCIEYMSCFPMWSIQHSCSGNVSNG